MILKFINDTAVGSLILYYDTTVIKITLMSLKEVRPMHNQMNDRTFKSSLFTHSKFRKDKLIQSIIEDYCGKKVPEEIGQNRHTFITEGIWRECGINPSYEYKVLIELLHLAYTRGNQD